MSGAQRLVGHRTAAAIHIETAALRWAKALQELEGGDAVGAASQARSACDNVVFAAHHAAEAERVDAAIHP